jgi:hypothetical protein
LQRIGVNVAEQGSRDESTGDRRAHRFGTAREVRRLLFTVVAYGVGVWFLLVVVLPSVDSQF